MRALMKVEKGEGHFEVRDIPKPIITKPDDILIKVSAAGVCGTDIHILHDKFQNYPPVVLGHEFSGIVEDVGENVERFKQGDRVVGEPHTLACGICDACRHGKIQICKSKRSPGWGIDGAFTDYLVMPEKMLHRVPGNVSQEVAALAEPTAIVTHAVLERGRVEPQDFVVVVGAGPIGVLSAFVAKMNGAARVAVVGVDADEPLRFKVADKLGADIIINASKKDVAAEIFDLTNGRGADLVVEASGSQSGVNTAIDIVRQCGRITAIGLSAKDSIQVKWDAMINKVLDVAFNLSSSYSSWDRALSMMERSPYDLSAAITQRESIENWESVFDEIQKGNAVKAMFFPAS